MSIPLVLVRLNGKGAAAWRASFRQTTENKACASFPASVSTVSAVKREAFEFYAAALRGKLFGPMTYADAPLGEQMPPGLQDHVMHVQREADGANLMGADGMPPHDRGGTACINVDVSTVQGAERIFAALAQGGRVQMQIAETFWALRWSTFTDRYGKPWMVNCMKPMS